MASNGKSSCLRICIFQVYLGFEVSCKETSRLVNQFQKYFGRIVLLRVTARFQNGPTDAA